MNWRIPGLAEEERRFLDEAGRGCLLCLGCIFFALAVVARSLQAPGR